MRLARLEGKAQRFPGTEKMRLADDVIEHARPQPVGKRRVRLALLE